MLALVCFFLWSCRPRIGAPAELREAAVSPQPTAAFLDACKKFPTTSSGETREIFAAAILAAHENASALDLVQTTPCPVLWQRIVDKGELALWESKDLAPATMFTGMTPTKLVVKIKSFPAHFDVLAQLPAVELLFEPASSGFNGLDAAARATLFKVVTAHPERLKRLSLNQLGLGDLTPIAGLTGLTELSIPGNGLTDLTFLAGMTEMRRLIAYDNGITDLTPLENLLSLQYLSLEGNAVKSLEPLLVCANLQALYFRDNVGIDSLFALQYLPNLAELDVANAPIATIEPLAKLPLRILSIDGTKVSSLEPLRKAPLQQLYLSGTKVQDLAPLAEMPQLTKLNVSSTGVSKLPNLPGAKLAIVDLFKTAITDLCPLFRLPTMKALRLPNGASMNAYKMQSASYDCPQN